MGPRARGLQRLAPRHMGSSQTRDRTCVPCIARRTFIHCSTKKSWSWLLKEAGTPGTREGEGQQVRAGPSTGMALLLPLSQEARPPAQSETADGGRLEEPGDGVKRSFQSMGGADKPWQCVWQCVWPAGPCCLCDACAQEFKVRPRSVAAGSGWG